MNMKRLKETVTTDSSNSDEGGVLGEDNIKPQEIDQKVT